MKLSDHIKNLQEQFAIHGECECAFYDGEDRYIIGDVLPKEIGYIGKNRKVFYHSESQQDPSDDNQKVILL